MKKFLSIAAVCAMAMVTMVSCEPKNPTPKPAGTPTVNVAVDKATIAPTGKATVTLTATANVAEAVEFTITTSDATVATISSEKVTMASGTKTSVVEVTAVKEGKVTITAATTSNAVKMGTASVEVTVKEQGTELEDLVTCDASNTWSELWFASEDDGLGAGFTLWYNSKVLLENVGCDYVGADLALAPVEKGTEISSLEFVANPGHVLMGTNKSEGYDQLPDFSKISGTQYVAFCVMTNYVEPLFDADGVITNPQDFTHDKPQTKGWALVTSDNGAVTLHAYKFPADKVGE